ncbi:MAG: hypothetical protein ACRDNH_14145 [Gaiellaceae bacterium]
MSEQTLISPARIEQGRWIYSAWKHLRNYRAQTIASFEATALAGRSCDLLGRMRQLAPYSIKALVPLAKDAGIARQELKTTVLPTLEALGILRMERDGATITSVSALVISQDDVMDQIARLWDHLDPEAPERGALVLLQQTATMPSLREEAAGRLVLAGLDDEEAEQAIELALAHDLIRVSHVADLSADVLYNDFLWGENIDRVGAALAALNADLRDGLRALLEELHKHEGRPADEIESASPELVQLAITQGLVDATEIKTTGGRTATFHFTPLFRGFGVSRDHVSDVLDQVKLVIASFAFSTRYATFRLRDPEVFLDSLISRGYAGNASPIGTDYGAMEKQKVVNVEPVAPGSSRYRFRSVKRDALIEARDTMRAGALLLPNPRGNVNALLREPPHNFVDPVATRQHLAQQAGETPLFDASLLAAIREAAQKEGF